METQYRPQTLESTLYKFWESSNHFAPKNDPKLPSYCIVMPPPNVTGVLHMGHAIVNTLQDVLIRWKRMLGFNVLWVPGVDHAGIATQTVVERNLIKTFGKKRVEFSREEFLSHVWKWKEENEHIIVNQLKRLGCSCDWNNLRFTLDDVCSTAVKSVFKRMFDSGLIYRGDYLVNWDPVTQTALADDEVEYEDHQGFLWSIKYPIKDEEDAYIVIATTRPETMLADVAVAMNPQDERYKHLLGKKIILPLSSREIPIIADSYVQKDFGTGLVKITPAHDPNDYEIGLRHSLPRINMMNPDGTVNENGGNYCGFSMQAARTKVVEDLQKLQLIESVRPHQNRVGVSYRSKAIIEPYMSKQWFVKMDGFKKGLKNAILQGEVKFTPKNWENTYFHWIDNLRDWCISRQLWWGHQIPVWYNVDDPSKMLCSDSIPREVKENPDKWVQDSDVLDTWFSSGLWPFSVLHFPEIKSDLKNFYPNSALVTGHDILFFWVARMMFMGKFAMNKWPFKDVFLHGLIYGKSYWRKNEEGIRYVSNEERIQYDLGTSNVPKDVFSKWEKMSKSKGNVIDPIELIEEFGADAIRLGLCASSPQSQQIDLDRRKFNEFRNFTNKIWNGARFCLSHLDSDYSIETLKNRENFSNLLTEDYRILFKLYKTIEKTNEYLQSFQFDLAALGVYEFFWDDFCSLYVELSKPILFKKSKNNSDIFVENKKVILSFVLENFLLLMHPFAPFITEEVFQNLKKCNQSKSIMLEKYPTIDDFIFNDEKNLKMMEEKSQVFSTIENILTHLRMLRSTQKVPPHLKTNIVIKSKNEPLIKENEHIFYALLPINDNGLFFDNNKNIGPTQLVPNLNVEVEVAIETPQELKELEHERNVKRVQKLHESIQKLTTQLANESFRSKAPAPVIEKMQQQLQLEKKELEQLGK